MSLLCVRRACEEWLQSACSAAADSWCVCLVLNCLGVGSESNVFTRVCVCVCSSLSRSEQFTINMLDSPQHNCLLGCLLVSILTVTHAKILTTAHYLQFMMWTFWIKFNYFIFNPCTKIIKNLNLLNRLCPECGVLIQNPAGT